MKVFNIILLFASLIVINSIEAAGINISAVPMLNVEFSKLDMVGVIDTQKLSNGVEKTNLKVVESGLLMLSVTFDKTPSNPSVSLSVESITEGTFDQKSLDQCLYATTAKLSSESIGGNKFLEKYIISYELNNDDGDNYCGVRLKLIDSEKVIIFGYRLND